MIDNIPIDAYLDFNLTKKLESFVINALPYNSYRSDFNMLYIANIDTETIDGVIYQYSVFSSDTIFIAITNDFGHIDYSIVKTIHAPDAIESEYEVMEYYPNDSDLSKFSTYHKNNPVPAGGGYIDVAISPFGVTKIKLLSGKEVQFFGNGRIRIDESDVGFSHYTQVPIVNEILTNGIFKILKIALYTRYSEFQHRKYSLNIFSPTMEIKRVPMDGQFSIDEESLIHYSRNRLEKDEDNGYMFLRNEKNDSLNRVLVSSGKDSLLSDFGKMLRVIESGFIDISNSGPSIGSTFSIHINFMLEEYAQRGTIIFDSGYGTTDSGYMTHKITLFVDDKGSLHYNCRYSDEHIDTGVLIDLDKEHVITFTVDNQRGDEADTDEFVTFIHLNGHLVWPIGKDMPTDEEKRYMWRGKEAWRVYEEVCLTLPAPHPVQGGLDSKSLCAKKLLEESGLITLDNLNSIYAMYLNRPTASDADLNDIEIGSDENTTITKLVLGQDAELDLADSEYYMVGQFSDIAVFSPCLNREEIEGLHLLNVLRAPSVKL